MADAPYAKAPAWRRTGAGLLDMAAFGGLFWLARSRAPEGTAVNRAMGGAVEVVREQLRSPGQLAFGIRTVDRRTGSRVALWRTLALVAARAAAAELVGRAQPQRTPELERERKAAADEIAAIMRRHPQSSPERAAELQAAYRRHSAAMPSLPRAVGPALLSSLVTSRLRRRLAPTAEVRA